METWKADDLRYFIIGDADPNDIQKLSDTLKPSDGTKGVADKSSFADLDDFLRVTVGTPAENDAFLAALDVVLAQAQVE